MHYAVVLCRLTHTVACTERIAATFTYQVSGSGEITADIGTNAET